MTDEDYQAAQRAHEQAICESWRFAPARQCQNCGGTRKEHGVRKPYQCRRMETYWKPWTAEEYAAAEKAGEEASRCLS